ncbi:MAG: hypothetical protein AAGK33_07295 [Pseudomonadota bacterium]
MPANFLNSLKKEVDEIHDQLSNNPLFVKWEKLREALAVYEAEDESATSPKKSAGRTQSVETAKILAATKKMLTSDTPLPTREIYDRLSELEIEVGGKEPVSNLSALLSNSDEFRSNGRAGWTIAGAGGGHGANYGKSYGLHTHRAQYDVSGDMDDDIPF